MKFRFHWWQVPLAIVLVGAGLATVLVINLSASALPVRDPRTLIISAVELPAPWQATWAAAPIGPATGATVPSAYRRDDQPGGRLEQIVYRYGAPWRAAVQHRFHDPVKAAAGDFGGGTARLPHWSSSYADGATVTCAGDIGRCHYWSYWARYGQYIVGVIWFDTTDTMPAATFGTLATTVDTSIARSPSVR